MIRAYLIVQICCILVKTDAWGILSFSPTNRPLTSHRQCGIQSITTNTSSRQLIRLNEHDSSRESTIANVENSSLNQRQSRRKMMSKFSSLLFSGSFLGHRPQPAASIPEQKSYSSNARNLDRLSAGDRSGGSVYDNYPSTPAASRRRAMLGCKTDAARQKAASMSNDASVMAEKDCNIRVMSGDSEFMLDALRTLDCPTCPYGIDGA